MGWGGVSVRLLSDRRLVWNFCIYLGCNRVLINVGVVWNVFFLGGGGMLEETITSTE